MTSKVRLASYHRDTRWGITLTFLDCVVSNVSEGVTDDLLVVDVGGGRDLSEDHNHASLGAGLACDTGDRILTDAGVEDGIGDLIAKFV